MVLGLTGLAIVVTLALVFSGGKPDRWVRITYRGLVDMSQITQSGLSVRDVLAALPATPSLRAELQPFLDQFSALLPQSLDMLVGPGTLPRYSVTDQFPPGSRQPAWAAIVRGGRICIIDDGGSHATVFVQGETAQAAYEANYGVLRHVLASLVPPDGGPLKVAVYAYRNDYALCDLSLNLNPVVFEARHFPPPRDKVSLDLDGIQEFFRQGAVLAGGKIDERDGLVLAGKMGDRQTMCGHDVELADLAVAYRAVFHAGDNAAFVSLDPHRDPTMVTVNFGGFLEDTRAGSVVLAADERFKTLTSGLDPRSAKGSSRGDPTVRVRVCSCFGTGSLCRSS